MYSQGNLLHSPVSFLGTMRYSFCHGYISAFCPGAERKTSFRNEISVCNLGTVQKASCQEHTSVFFLVLGGHRPVHDDVWVFFFNTVSMPSWYINVTVFFVGTVRKEILSQANFSLLSWRCEKTILSGWYFSLLSWQWAEIILSQAYYSPRFEYCKQSVL